MQRFCTTKLTLQTFLLYIIAVQHVTSKAVGQNDQALIPTQGLYDSSDHIVVLNATTLRSSIYGSKSAWIVEFYNSWCGFCHRFAPSWKALAQNILTWRDIVVVAAIDCADDDNNPVCREYEIMHYPMLRYFHVDAKPGNLGLEVEKGIDMDTIRQKLIDRLEKEQLEGRGSSWPNIVPYRNADLNNLWRDVPETVNYYFLIFETVDSFLGTEVILDLHNIGSLQVRSVTSDNEPLTIMFEVIKFPTLIALDRNGVKQYINTRTPTREGLRRAIKEFMSSKGIIINVPDTTDQHPGEWMKAQVPDFADIIKQRQKEEELKSFEDSLFQLDLETTLRYSINHEIPMIKVIEEERMEALKAYLNLLAKYFPIQPSGGVLFLDVIRNIINQRISITGEEFNRIVKSTEEAMSPVYSGPQQWLGCMGSKDTLRGYPCGLWTMFHMLTVNAVNQNNDNLQNEMSEVLRVMHGYIMYFFGCADCSQHFLEMADRNKILEVSSANDTILWLWQSHNEVNNRLSGDDTEDPKHKKIQYPSKEHCPQCRYTDNSWNKEEVLRYLKKKYSYSGINYYGSRGKSFEENDDDSKIRQERLVSDSYISQRRIGWDFTIFDISICVVLYVISAAILVLVCIKFAVKRTYKKKTYIHDLFGKV